MSDDLRVDVEHEQELLRVFSTRLNQLLDEHDYPKVPNQRMTRLATEFNASPSGARKWCRGEAIPSPGTLSKIALRFSTSLDYLLGLRDTHAAPNCKCTGKEVIAVPLYALDHFPASGEVESGKFRQVRSIYFEADENSVDVGNRFFAECWVDLNNPKIRKGDILLVDMNETHLTENGIYLFRTPTMLCIRRLVARLDGNAELIVEYGDRKDSDLVGPAEISFNQSKSPNEPASGVGIKVIGRVVAKIVKLDPRIHGLL